MDPLATAFTIFIIFITYLIIMHNKMLNDPHGGKELQRRLDKRSCPKQAERARSKFLRRLAREEQWEKFKAWIKNKL